MPIVGSRVDRAGRALVVEGDVAAGHRRAERAAGVGDAATRLAELEEDLRLLRVAEVEAVGDAERPRAGAGDVARRLGHGGLAALVRVERDAARVAVHGHRERRTRCPAPGARRRRRPGPSTVDACTRGVVLLVHPALARDVRAVEQELAARAGDRPSAATAGRRHGGADRLGSRAPRGGRSDSPPPAAVPGIAATVSPWCFTRKIPSSVTRPIGVAVELPLARRPPAPPPPDRGSATTSIRSCDSESRISYGVIPSSRVGTRPVSISTPTPPRAAISALELVSPAAPMSWMATMRPRGDQLEAGLEQQLLGERVAHLHLGTPRLALLRQLLGGEARAVNAVATGAGADREQHVADALRPRARIRSLLAEQADAHRVDQRIAGVARREADLAAERRHADAVAVVADAAHHAGEEIAVPRLVERPEAQAVEHRDGPRAHGEDVAQDAADAGGRALVRLDRRGMVVRLDLEGDRPAVGQPQHAGVLARPLDDLRARGGEGLEHRLGVLVAAVLRPERGEDAELGERRRRGRASRGSGSYSSSLRLCSRTTSGVTGRSPGKANASVEPATAEPVTCRARASCPTPRKAESARRAPGSCSAGRSSWAITSSSPASSHMPPQWGQVSIWTPWNSLLSRS